LTVRSNSPSSLPGCLILPYFFASDRKEEESKREKDIHFMSKEGISLLFSLFHWKDIMERNKALHLSIYPSFSSNRSSVHSITFEESLVGMKRMEYKEWEGNK